MKLTIQPVDTNHVHQVWPMVKDFIASAVDKGYPYPDEYRDYTLEHIQQFVNMGQWLLLVAIDEEGNIQGCGTVSFVNTPRHKNAVITTTGGRFVTTVDVVEQVKNIVKQRGATKIQTFARPAMVKLLKRSSYQPRNTLMEILL